MGESIYSSAHYILVVDDDELLNGLFCEFLQGKGFKTLTAYSLTEAVKLLKTEVDVDLVLLDYQLGDGNGLEFLAEVNSHTLLKKPPVIMVSGNEDPEFLESCFESGIDDYIIKPVNLSLLALKVSALIKAIAMQRVISLQNAELERFKSDAETRRKLLPNLLMNIYCGRTAKLLMVCPLWLKSSSSFCGDIALARISPSGDLYFLLADATGHGLAAAITVMPVVSIFNSMVAKGFHIQTIVAEMNKKLMRDTPEDRFVAAIFNPDASRAAGN